MEDCECPPEPVQKLPEKPAEKQKVRIRKEKRKKGKIVTTISGFDFVNQESYEELLKELKDKLGTGGTVEDSTLVLQGDQVARMETALREKGFQVKAL